MIDISLPLNIGHFNYFTHYTTFGGNTMPKYMRRKLIVYLIGIFTLTIGSNLFLNAALGVAPSCSLALTLTFLLPGSYALYNFIVNSLILILEALIVHKFGKHKFFNSLSHSFIPT